MSSLLTTLAQLEKDPTKLMMYLNFGLTVYNRAIHPKSTCAPSQNGLKHPHRLVLANIDWNGNGCNTSKSGRESTAYWSM
ncbi:MAG: hypothetical protein V3V18_09435 [Methylococcales bacterium]